MHQASLSDSQPDASAFRAPFPIEQFALTHELGIPHTRHRTKNQKIMALLGSIWLTYLLALISVIFFFFLSGTDKTWWFWLVWLSFASLLAFGIRSFLAQTGTPPINVFVCPEGLIYSQKSLPEAIPWDHVTAYWKDIALSNNEDVADTYHYILQRSDGRMFDFPTSLTEIVALGNLLEQKVCAYLLPRTLRTYEAGIPVAFDAILLSSSVLNVERGHKILPWSEIEGFSLDEETITIYQKGQKEAWHQQCIAQIANPGVLQRLMEHSLQEFVQQQLPRVIAAFNAGSVVEFGRVSLSQQGITIDKGKKTLSWREVRRIEVNTKNRQVSISNNSQLLSWHNLRTWQSLNVLVLKELADYALRKQKHYISVHVQNQFPQAIAIYNAGIPLTFGRVSFSLQGIGIDGGKHFLPWNQVAFMYIRMYLGGKSLTIAKKGKAFAWQALPLSELGDNDLLQRVVDHLIETRL